MLPSMGLEYLDAAQVTSNLASCCQFYLMIIIEIYFILRFNIFATFRQKNAF